MHDSIIYHVYVSCYYYPQSVESSEQLSSLTKNRVRPPSNRHPPSRQQSPSPSPKRPQSSAPSSGQLTVTRVGGITGISAESAPVSAEPNWPGLDAATLKQQWVRQIQLIVKCS